MKRSKKITVSESEWFSGLPKFDRESTKQPLVPNFGVSSLMRPYVGRITKFGIRDFAGDRGALLIAFREMSAILTKKRVRCLAARKAIYRTLVAASRHKLERLQLEKIDTDITEADYRIDRLIRHVRQLRDTFSEASKTAKGSLNKVIAQADFKNFDTEVYSGIFNGLVAELEKPSPQLSPPCIIQGALEIIRNPLTTSQNPEIMKVMRQGSPEMIDLWEALPHQTRFVVEAELSLWNCPSRAQLDAFLTRLEQSVAKNKPQRKKGRRQAITSRYLQSVSKLWTELRLKIGQARDASQLTSIESAYQRFARLGLKAIGDRTRISDRLIANLIASRRDRSTK